MTDQTAAAEAVEEQVDSVQDAPEGQNDEQEAKSLRDTLRDAFESASEAPEGDQEQVTQNDDVEGDGEPVEAQEHASAPQSWTSEAKEQWDTLPDWMKAEAHRLEDTFLKGREKYEGQSERLKTFEESIGADRLKHWEQNGGAGQWIKELIHYSDLAGRDPQGFVEWYLQNNGDRVDLSKFTGTQAQPKYVDPDLAERDQKIADLTSRLSSFEQQQVSAQQQQQSQIEIAFKEAKDGEGNLTHPHYETVKPMMVALAQANPSFTDEQLYQAAVRAHPDLGNEVIEQARKEAEQKAAEKAAEEARARKAQAASKSISGAPSEGATPLGVDPKDLRGTIRAAFEASQGDARV